MSRWTIPAAIGSRRSFVCKVILEGIIDMTPAGLTSFSLKPTLPAGLDHLSLTNVRAYGGIFGITLTHECWRVTRSDGKLIAEGKNGERTLVKM